MKKWLLLILLITSTLYAQKYDSTFIGAHSGLAAKGNRVITYSIPQNSNDIISTHYYDGTIWKRISKDTIPTIHMYNSRCTFSDFSDHLYITGHYHLWEYDGKDWLKHAIYDSMYHRRRFEDIIELPDSSLLITAFTQIIKSKVGNVTIIGKIFHELLRFKDGKFTTVKSRWSEPHEGYFSAYQKLRLNKNGTYTLITFEEADELYKWEFVTYSVDGTIVRKDSLPSVKPFGFKDYFVTFSDHLFDSKGSMWFLTQSQDDLEYDSLGNPVKHFIPFVGLVEVTIDGTINLYNDNVGIDKSTYKSNSFTIDDEDNIWFFYSYQRNNTSLFPSLYKLHSDRVTVTEFTHETMYKHSIIYNGGKLNHSGSFPHYNLLVFDNYNKSLFVAKNGAPLLQFFPNNIPLSVSSEQIQPIQLYPNPVQFGNTLTIESSLFENVHNSLSVVIRDISGATVREELISTFSNLLSINTVGLSRGTYYISVLNNNKLILQTSFVKE